MQTIQFEWGYAALLLVGLLPIAWGFVHLYLFRKEHLETFAKSSVLSVVVLGRQNSIYWIKSALFAIAWISGVIALMQPKGNERYLSSTQHTLDQPHSRPEEMRRKHHTIIFLIDVSASMAIEDGSGGKSRLTIAKRIADDVIGDLQGESVALFAFTASTMQIVPSTMDYLFTRLMLENIEINEGETSGTDIEAALQAIKKSFPENSTKTLVILTDGGDTSLEGITGAQRLDKIHQITQPLEDAQKMHMRTLAVGIGSQKGSDVPNVTFKGLPVTSSPEVPLLKKLAALGEGKLWLTYETPLIDISREVSKSIKNDMSYVDISNASLTSNGNENYRIYDIYYQYPLVVAILALVCCVLLPNATPSRSTNWLYGRLEVDDS